MSDEISYLTYTALFTALLWVPYVLNRISVLGLLSALGYPENPSPGADWAIRLKAVHSNGVENLVVFAPLVLIVEITGISSAATALSCMIFFYARIVHALSYTFAVPYVRTLSFAVSFFAMMGIAWQIITA
jgi:uncharacterized MAPEG superfamily protein